MFANIVQKHPLYNLIQRINFIDLSGSTEGRLFTTDLDMLLSLLPPVLVNPYSLLVKRIVRELCVVLHMSIKGYI